MSVVGAAVSLNHRQERFLAEYLVTGCGAEAARRAGYSASSAKVTASRLLTKANLKSALEAREAALAEKFEIDTEAVVGGILQAIADARHQGNPSNMIRGWVSIARIAGLERPQAAVCPSDGGGERLHTAFEAMSDDELLAITEQSSR